MTFPVPTGLSQFRYAADIALQDLLYLGTSLSDNTAAGQGVDVIPPRSDP